MKHWLPVTALMAGVAVAHAADPQEIWDEAVKAKGGRERLHSVHSLAVYLKPAEVNLRGPATTLLCVFPDRYFEFDGRGSGEYPYVGANGAMGIAESPRAIVVDAKAGRVAMDANGTPRGAWRVGPLEQDRLTLNQIVFLLETAWLNPHPVEAKRNEVKVEAGGRMFRVSLDRAGLPERVLALPLPGEKPRNRYDYHLSHYRDFQGVMLPARVAWTSGTREWVWDADYEIDAKFNPKMFERVPDLADGPEPWRRR
jgi:hypothetical protein